MAETNLEAETALMGRIALGDQKALADLYDRLAPLAYGLALRIAGDSRLAQDAVQVAFLRAWDHADSYREGRGSPRGWVLRIVRNASIDQLRAEQSRRRAEARAGDEPDNGASTAGPERLLASSERNAQLRDALDTLPQEQRHVIEINYFQGLSHAEIAEREMIPLGTVKTRIRDGVRRLRKLAEEGKLDV